MLHSIATVSVRGNLEEKLRAIAAAGFKGVEIFENDFLSFPGTAHDIVQLMYDLGLTCTAYQPFRDFEGMPDSHRQQVFDRMEHKFDLMESLGAKTLLVCSNVSPLALPDGDRIVADFQELGERAAKRSIMIGYEALAWGRHVFDHRDVWSIVKKVDHPNIGIILDSFHSLSRDIPNESLRDIDPKKIALVQIADAPKFRMDELYWSRHFRNMPGQGDLALEEYVGILMDIGYDGPLSLEIFNDHFRAASAKQIAADGFRSLVNLEDKLLQSRKKAKIPARAISSGIEFLEFAAEELEAKKFTAILEALGFKKVGQHKYKTVSRWRQGDINIVVNSEARGFAHSHETVHGCSVCAIGFRVKDASAAMARAEALKIPSFTQPVSLGDIEIPAVRGVGGALIYFVEEAEKENIWATEFIEIEMADENSESDLKTFDHISQSVFHDEMLSWILFYTALFDVEKTETSDIADPSGLVQSLAIENADRSLRVTLNSSAANQTLSSRFLKTYLGAGVQHIAFDTDDIFKTVERALSKGVQALEIPNNYYDDLQARFGLTDDFVKRLSDLNILYDNDGGHEYFQFYTRAFSKLVFFEIVERRSYQHYGAANAPIRLSSQSQFKDPEWI